MFANVEWAPVEWLWIRAGAQDRERATGSERTQQVDKLDNKVAVVSAPRGARVDRMR
jgi:hypothetical protein